MTATLAPDALAEAVGRDGSAVARDLFATLCPELIRLQDDGCPATQLRGVLLTDAFLLHEALNATLTSLLGPAFVIARVNLGAGASALLATTRDRAILFGDAGADARAPLFSVTLFVPLSAATLSLGSRHAAQDPDNSAGVTLFPGDALLLDSRECAGLAGAVSVPGLLVTFTRPWFREPQSPPDQPPIELPLIDFLRLPAPVQARLQWRFDRYLRHRPLLLAYQVASWLPAPLGAPIKRKLRGWASSY